MIIFLTFFEGIFFKEIFAFLQYHRCLSYILFENYLLSSQALLISLATFFWSLLLTLLSLLRHSMPTLGHHRFDDAQNLFIPFDLR